MSRHTFLVADLAGYTALTEAHGDEDAADAAADFWREVRARLRGHRAEEVKTMGDGVLVHVDDASDAVRLAESVVCGYGARHLSLGVRAGIHTGTAVRRGHDWFGSAVNITARVADLACAGEVVLTETTRALLDPAILVHARGPHTFKNVPRPLEVYSLAIEEHRLVRLPIDPVCHMAVDPDRAVARHVLDGVEYYLCSAECAARFEADPQHYVRN
jgi:adenylate cyclase